MWNSAMWSCGKSGPARCDDSYSRPLTAASQRSLLSACGLTHGRGKFWQSTFDKKSSRPQETGWRSDSSFRCHTIITRMKLLLTLCHSVNNNCSRIMTGLSFLLVHLRWWITEGEQRGISLHFGDILEWDEYLQKKIINILFCLV